MSNDLRNRIKRFCKLFLGTGLAIVLGGTVVAFAVDYAVFRSRLARNSAYGQITVSSYDAVQQKNGKTVFMFNPPQPQPCVHSLFGHAGFVPCWYLQRHTEPRTDI